MAQVEWPTRYVSCATATGSPAGFFRVNPSDRDSIIPGSRCILRNQFGVFTRYIQLDQDRRPPEEWFITDSNGTRYTAEGSFILEFDVGIVTNYPTRPMLVDPAAQSITSVTNPLGIKGYTQGEPRYQGSVTLDVDYHMDVPIVEAFIDQIYDPESWFELPLPGNHLTAQNVTGYDDTNGNITMALNSVYGDRNLHGYFARVGARTVRIIYHRRQGISNNHVIRIVPALINGITADGQENSFSDVNTVRVRASNITSQGNPDYGATWTMDWVETDRSD